MSTPDSSWRVTSVQGQADAKVIEARSQQTARHAEEERVQISLRPLQAQVKRMRLLLVSIAVILIAGGTAIIALQPSIDLPWVFLVIIGVGAFFALVGVIQGSGRAGRKIE